MQIAAYINGNVNPQRIAEHFAEEIVKRSNREGQLAMDVAVDFVRSNLSLIGFPCAIDAQQVATGEFEWPTEARIYTFPYNSIQFAAFASFLTQLTTVMGEHQRAFNELQQEEGEISQLIRPLTYLVELLAVWHGVCQSLEQHEESFCSRRFEEPIARINFSLLLGMHEVRKTYRLDFHHLDATCDRLYRGAVKGIFYRECHTELVGGLSQLFANDFDVFYQHSADSLNFFLEVFSVQRQRHTYIRTFKLLEEMLQNPSWTQNQLLILTDFLIEGKMQEVYYSVLKLQSTKYLLLACLDFLDSLQSKLPTVDCFSKAFVEVFWTVILNKDTQVSSEAAEVYVAIMKRKFDDRLILKHIVEGYFTKMSSPAALPQYVNTFWPIFQPIRRLNEYLEIISSPRTANSFRAYVAHFLVAIFRELKKFGKYRNRIEYLLLQLPSLLEEMSCRNTIGVLLEIYANTDFQDLQRSFPRHMDIFLSLETYAVNAFFGENNAYPLLTNLFTLFTRCMKYTHNWSQLEIHAVATYHRFQEIEHKLGGKLVNPGTMHEYNIVLQKLALILKPDYDVLDYLPQLVEAIEKRLITQPEIYVIAEKTKTFPDIYAISILTSCLGKLVGSVSNEREKLFITTHTLKLQLHLYKSLKNLELQQKTPLVRIETIFNNFIELHFKFNRKSNAHHLINVQIYHLLVDTLVLCNFVMKTLVTAAADPMQLHPLRTEEYQISMFRQFIRLHANENLELPSNIVWKVCIFYGLPGHKFNAQLRELLKIIAEKHLNLFKHILPVIVFNLYKRQPPLNERTILQALKAHSDLISTQLEVDAPFLLKMHIVLTVAQMVKKSMGLVRLNPCLNRLMALRHLHTLVAGVQWTDKIVVDMILKLAAEIKEHLLTPDETRELQKFSEYFEKQI